MVFGFSECGGTSPALLLHSMIFDVDQLRKKATLGLVLP